ncbi:endo alpha-1,4 polygalactosaminidase [Sphaerisporangium corydalis]|uniref:Endo alpha-1,4 polygalactosaminidase n=1 Tax=Sphaerisporangium corydalis TaxID=1441875 RepID=A0ABV9E9Q7_9ACTN|nr:endo alpha-1,4 polygalactosaminidase [Sphaerisporangium corydalis]
MKISIGQEARSKRGVRTAAIMAAALALAVTGPAAQADASATTHAEAAEVWRPAPGTTWQWQITEQVRAPFQNVAMYDIDLQDAVPSARTKTIPGFGSVTWPAGDNAGIVDRLHAAGKIAICYLDTGAYEGYRPDASLFPRSVIGNNSGWEDENWLDIRPASLSSFAPIMWSRLDLAKEIGCDGVEPDQNNPLGNNPGFPITKANEKAWYLEVARQAHDRGLSVGMKNGVEVVDADTVAAFDWALNEECYYYEECDTTTPFIAAGKAVFQTEYVDDWRDDGLNTPAKVAAEVCPSARADHFSTLVKNEVPDTLFLPC